MADNENEFPFGYVDVRRNPKGQESPTFHGGASRAFGSSTVESWRPIHIATLRNRLNGLNAAYYTEDRLNKMTKNDMVYALRLADEAAGIK